MRTITQLLSLLFIFSVFSCDQQKENKQSAQSILLSCIEAHGGSAYDSMDISFDFRQYRVRLKNNHGNFLYERSRKDSLGNTWQETLTNEGFIVKQNDTLFALSDSAKSRLQEGLNAIAYFALLPFKLADPAVKATYIGDIEIDGRLHKKVAVSFSKENGGNDHLDEFCYWIDEQTNQLKYLAYSNGGPRFRKAIRSNNCGGIIIQDYENYSMADTTINTIHYDSAYLLGKFKVLSLIEQTNFKNTITTN